MAAADSTRGLAADERARLRAQIRALRAEVRDLRARLASHGDGEDTPPALPPLNADGTRPALETVWAILGQKVLAMRQSVGLSRAELARRARVRPSSVARIERGEGSPSRAVMAKIDRALKAAGAGAQSGL